MRRDDILNLKDPSFNEYDGEQAYTESESDGPDRTGRRRRSSKGKHRQAVLPPKLREMLAELQERGVPKNPREEDVDLEYLDSILEVSSVLDFSARTLASCRRRCTHACCVTKTHG